MNNTMFLFIALGYLTGSIPFAVLISKYKFGKDVRNMGSGNAGATNMARNFGKKAGLITLILDVAKGAIPTAAYIALTASHSQTTALNEMSAFIIAYATGLGHIFPVFGGFKGGKGVATLLGSMLVVHPQFALIGLLFFVFILWISSYVSLASIISALLFAGLVAWQQSFSLASLLVWGFPILLIYTHRSNIVRLVQGNENKTHLFKKK
jgi:glycerol-3-phosphate acyltransferase PlsY